MPKANLFRHYPTDHHAIYFSTLCEELSGLRAYDAMFSKLDAMANPLCDKNSYETFGSMDFMADDG